MTDRNTAALALILLTAACRPVGAEPGDDVQWTQEELERVSAEIQAEVADMRGRPFLRPVAVELSDKAGFLEHARTRMERMTPEGKLESDQDIARHLGMIPTDMDLLATTMDLLAEQVGGFYSPTSETFYLMRSFTGDAAKVILAHELCHALDDQHFDLDGGFERTLASTDESTAYAAVVEGSGTMLMTRYTVRHMGELSPDDLVEASSVGVDSLAAAPPYIWKPLMAVYQQGQTFLNDGYRLDRRARKGEDTKADPNDSVDGAFTTPPRSTEQVLHPEKYWVEEERDEPRAVAHRVDALPEGWHEAQRDVLGELQLAIFTTPFDDRTAPDLADPMAALSLRYTNEAASGWGGDEVLLLAKNGARIVHLATVWDTERDAEEFRAAAKALVPELTARLRTLAGGDASACGVTVGQGSTPDEVRVVAWSGASAEELARVLASVTVSAARGR